MKRICLMGAAVAGLFTAGITTAASAAPAKFRTKTVTKTVTQLKVETKTVRSNVSCKPALLVQVTAGSTTILQGSETGSMFGSAGCGAPLFRGVSHLSYAEDTGGNLSGPIQQWFNAGSLFGTFTLTPAPTTGPPTTTSFTQQTYSGTVTIKGGSGELRGTTGTGRMSCATTDAIYYACTETAKLTQTVKVAVEVKVPVKIRVRVRIPA